MVLQSCSIFQNLVVNYHLEMAYPRQCHIGINLNHLYAIITTMHTMLLFEIFQADI